MGNSVLDVQILHSLHLKGIPRKAPKVIPVFWHPPIADWIKVNTDGLSKGNPGIAASGGVFRNYRGFMKGFFGLCLGIQTAFFAELKSVILAVSFAWEKGWHSLWIESDSSAVISSLQNYTFKPPWPLLNEWRNCLSLIKKMNVIFSHIYREGNSIADKIANLALNFFDLTWWHADSGVVPSELARDMLGLPFYRSVS
ncbi:hypothetical protein L1049_016764 [Liquidambar formosana]|uniref:RNase H type-1 domain-containing protein n=1 Tax=Liquidambar formosana TaxID=63359 RepID=A0AAP0S1Z9_LIQFO